jgi:tetratricopeptide (TPR) repeat protein
VQADPKAVFALTPTMREYLADSILPTVRGKGREGLIDALYSSQHLRLDYDSYMTRNAGEAFAARSGNCLSLVIMTSAFARALGMDVRYQQLRSEGIWVRDGDLVQLVGHVNLSLGQSINPALRTSSPTGWVTIDFLPLDDAQRERTQVISEDRVIAMYFNNKAAEALSASRAGEAYWWARASIEHDSLYPSAYITLGVVWVRHGRPDRAEAALRHALQLEPDNPQALHNLADALRALGRPDEADAIVHRLARVQPENPISSYKAGLVAYQRADYVRARDAFKQALRRAPDDHEFHFMLGMAYSKLGDKKSATEHLERARELAPTASRGRTYAAKMQLVLDANAKPSVLPSR